MRKMSKTVSIQGIAIGADHVLLLTEEGRVYTFAIAGHMSAGCSYDKYQKPMIQLGHGEIAIEYEPTEIIRKHIQPDTKFIQVAGGSKHSLLLAADKKTVYGFGTNAYKVLGMDTNTYKLPAPIKLTPRDKNDKIKKIYAQDHTGLILYESGYMLVLGKGWMTMARPPSAIPGIPYPLSLPNLDQSKGEKAIDIATGGSHTLFLTNLYRVYGCGATNHHVLGEVTAKFLAMPRVGPEPLTHPTPVLLSDLHNQKIIKIAVGEGYSMVLNAKHHVLVCGEYSCDYSSKTFVPIETHKQLDIKEIVAFDSKNFLLTKASKVYFCGFNHYNSAGWTGKNTFVSTPNVLKALANENIVKIFTSDCRTYFVSKAGKIIYYGTEHYEQDENPKAIKMSNLFCDSTSQNLIRLMLLACAYRSEASDYGRLCLDAFRIIAFYSGCQRYRSNREFLDLFDYVFRNINNITRYVRDKNIKEVTLVIKNSGVSLLKSSFASETKNREQSAPRGASNFLPLNIMKK